MRIPTILSNVAAIVLLLLAVLLGTAAMAGAAAAKFVDTPDPLQNILSPLATDPQLRQVLPPELGGALSERITEESAVPALLAPALQRAIESAAGAMLDTPSFKQSWSNTIELARTDFVDQLDAAAAAGEGASEQVSLRLDLAPLLGTGYDALHTALSGSRLGDLLPETLSVPAMVLDTGWPDAAQLPTDTVNSALAVARGWGLFAGGAVLTAALGLLLGVGAGRRWAVLVAGAAALLLGGGIKVWFGNVFTASSAGVADESVESLVTARLLSGLQGELGSITTTLVICGIVLVVGAAGWLWLRSRPHLEAPGLD